jgi:hypothetical protein
MLRKEKILLREAWIYHPARCCWILAWIPADEPGPNSPPPGAHRAEWNEVARSY